MYNFGTMPWLGPNFLTAFLTTRDLFRILYLTCRAVVEIIIVNSTRNNLSYFILMRKLSHCCTCQSALPQLGLRNRHCKIWFYLFERSLEMFHCNVQRYLLSWCLVLVSIQQLLLISYLLASIGCNMFLNC